MAWYLLKKGTTAKLKGEVVRVLEIIGDTAYVFIISIQKEVAVPFKRLRNIKPKPKIIN